MTSQHTLRVHHLAKRYHRHNVIVDDVSLELNTGEVVGLLGPNGAGKTTSFYMIVGLVRPDKGEIWLNEKNLTALPVHQRAQAGIAYLPQDASIFRKLTVAENILAILELRPELDAKGRQDELGRLLTQLQLNALYDRQGALLSGGERRRVEIARALATAPHFILFDEPFAGIDPISINELKQIIHALKKNNIGVLITDHNVRDTLSICDRGYIVHAGQILASGKPEKLLQHPEVQAVYLGENFSL